MNGREFRRIERQVAKLAAGRPYSVELSMHYPDNRSEGRPYWWVYVWTAPVNAECSGGTTGDVAVADLTKKLAEIAATEAAKAEEGDVPTEQ